MRFITQPRNSGRGLILDGFCLLNRQTNHTNMGVGSISTHDTSKGRPAPQMTSRPAEALSEWLQAPSMVKWVIDACDPASKEGNGQFSREAGGQAPLHQRVSGAFHRPRARSLPNVLISLNVLFLIILSSGNNSAVNQ